MDAPPATTATAAATAPAAIEAPYVYAANDERPRGAQEEELCATASSPDWLYMGASVSAWVLSLYADAGYLRYREQPGVRTIGPGLVGLTWGFTLGGGYLAQPRCNGLVRSPPPEGDVRTTWHVAVALAMLASLTSPMIEFFFNTQVDAIPLDWSVSERRFRLVAGAGGGFVGALLPYVLPPKTWRAAKELEKIRLGGDTAGGFVTYTVRF